MVLILDKFKIEKQIKNRKFKLKLMYQVIVLTF